MSVNPVPGSSRSTRWVLVTVFLYFTLGLIVPYDAWLTYQLFFDEIPMEYEIDDEIVPGSITHFETCGILLSKTSVWNCVKNGLFFSFTFSLFNPVLPLLWLFLLPLSIIATMRKRLRIVFLSAANAFSLSVYAFTAGMVGTSATMWSMPEVSNPEDWGNEVATYLLDTVLINLPCVFLIVLLCIIARKRQQRILAESLLKQDTPDPS